VGDEEDAANQRTEGAEGHGEGNGVREDGLAGGRGEAVLMLEGAEAAGDHGVLKEVGRIEAGDERDVGLGQAELAAAPVDAVAGLSEAAGAGGAGRGDGVHVQLVLDEGEGGGELEATLDGGGDLDGVGDEEHRVAVKMESGVRV